MVWPSNGKWTSSMPCRSAHAPNSASAPGAPPLNRMKSLFFMMLVSQKLGAGSWLGGCPLGSCGSLFRCGPFRRGWFRRRRCTRLRLGSLLRCCDFLGCYWSGAAGLQRCRLLDDRFEHLSGFAALRRTMRFPDVRFVGGEDILEITVAL